MDLAAISQMEREEKSYWWHVGRREILVAVLNRFLPAHNQLEVVDVGCGTGVNFGWLKNWGRVTGLDISEAAIRYCQDKRAYDDLIEGDVSQLPLNRFDLITAFDILEHTPDDRAALESWNAGLRPGGHLLMTVPAYQWLFSAHDRALHHFRRYSAFELKQKLKASGFEIQFLSPFFFFTFPAVAIVRLLTKYRPPKTSYTKLSPSLNTLLVNLSETEARSLASGIGFPWGSSIIVVARKI